MKNLISLSILLLCAFALSTHAAVVYSQPYNTHDNIDAVYTSDANNVYIIVDDFILDRDYLITDVHWWGVYLYSAVLPEDDFTIDFLPYNSGPALPPLASYDVLQVDRTDTGDVWTDPHSGAQFTIYRYSYDLPSPLPLVGGTPYCISIYNNTPFGEWALSYADSLAGDIWYHSSPANTDFQPSRPDSAFELTANNGALIPEPLTCLLFGGSVLLGLGRLRRRMC